MAKRFTDTNKYKKPFIRSLPGAYKILWDFLYHDCDHAGIWTVDFETAQIYVGKDMPISRERALELFNEEEKRVVEIDRGKKWFLPGFIEFQYGAQLVETNRMHVPIINTLKKYDLINTVNMAIVCEGTTANAFRERITKKVKQDILLRDQFTCQYCSLQYQFEELVVDHVVPLKNGGNNNYDNLLACCVRCNSHKTDLYLSDFAAKNHTFFKPTTRVLNMLQAPYKPLQGAMDMDKDKDKDKDMDKDKGREEGAGGETIEQRLDAALVDLYLEPLAMKAPTLYPGVDFNLEVARFRQKVTGSPRVYAEHDTGGLRLALEHQLRNARPSTPNGKPKPDIKRFLADA